MQKNMKPDHLFMSHTKINSKWIKDLNLRPETIKLLEENIESNLSDIVLYNFFSDISPWTKKTKEKINKWEGNHQQNEKTPHWMEEILINDSSDKGLIFKIYKKLIPLNTKKTERIQF